MDTKCPPELSISLDELKKIESLAEDAAKADSSAVLQAGMTTFYESLDYCICEYNVRINTTYIEDGKPAIVIVNPGGIIILPAEDLVEYVISSLLRHIVSSLND